MSTPDIQYFGTSGTWSKPAGAVRVDYLVCGAGGGGSVDIGQMSRDGEPGALRCGSLDPAVLPDTMEVEIGRGGRGAVLGPFRGGDGADGYALIVTHLTEDQPSAPAPNAWDKLTRDVSVATAAYRDGADVLAEVRERSEGRAGQ